MAAAFERQAHGVGMRHVTVESLADGGLELAGAVPVEQADQQSGDGAEVVAALGGPDQQGLAGRRRLGETIAGAVLPGGAFLCDQRPQMRGRLATTCWATRMRSRSGSASTVRTRRTWVWGSE